MFNRILTCSDGSESALCALRAATELANRFDAEIVVLSVFNLALTVPPIAGLPEGSLTAETVQHYADDLKRAAETLQAAMERKAEEICEASGARYRFRRDIGHPVDRIVTIAREEQADLIVMGSRGLSEWTSLLLGSVSEGVLHHAHCPVMIVR